jgi:ADP-ribosyl-[dinitrogen reductase] hydrolase
MLIELAIGDAYGAGFEYVSEKIIREQNNLSAYRQHARHNITPGNYTDDTQMTLAVVEAMLSGEDWTPELLANFFVEAFKRDPREGYASRFYDFLCEIKSGSEFLQKIIADSEKSGAAMRAMPLGLYADIHKVIEYSKIQAAVTHNTAKGINASIASSLMLHYFRFQLGPKDCLDQFLQEHVEGDWTQEWNGKVGALGVMSVSAAITAIKKSDTMSELLKACVNFSGDVDTVATIALAAASFSTEIQQDLPENLYQGLERSRYGYDYLQLLDEKLKVIQ